jgi:hypothetical protein
MGMAVLLISGFQISFFSFSLHSFWLNINANCFNKMHTYIHIYTRTYILKRLLLALERKFYIHMHIHTHIHTYIYTEALTLGSRVQASQQLWSYRYPVHTVIYVLVCVCVCEYMNVCMHDSSCGPVHTVIYALMCVCEYMDVCMHDSRCGLTCAL